jgi:acyl carrier protein
VWGDSDDAGYFALEVENRLGIAIPRDEWSMVYTIQDVIDLFKRHRNHVV